MTVVPLALINDTNLMDQIINSTVCAKVVKASHELPTDRIWRSRVSLPLK